MFANYTDLAIDLPFTESSFKIVAGSLNLKTVTLFSNLFMRFLRFYFYSFLQGGDMRPVVSSMKRSFLAIIMPASFWELELFRSNIGECFY